MPDPDLDMVCVCVWGGGRLQKNFFRPFKPHFGLKIRGGGGRAGPLGPFPGSATGGDVPLRNGVTAGDVNKFLK